MRTFNDCECPKCREHGNPDCRTDKCGGLVGYPTNGEYIKELTRLSAGSGEGNTLKAFIDLLAEVELLPFKRQKAIMTAVGGILEEETSR